MRRFIALGSALLLLAVVSTWLLNLRLPQPVELIPALTGEPEYCLTCHNDLAQISPSHPVETFGCVLCHGGEALALNADLAHSSMRGGANPSDLSVVETSCGGSECHSGSEADDRNHIQRVMTSVQSTYAGALANILYALGEQPDLTARYSIEPVSDAHVTTSTGLASLQTFDAAKFGNPSVQKFAQNCLTCHINAPSIDEVQYNRLTGCAACHTPEVDMFPEGQIHELTTAIPYTQCNACHNRGNYDLRSMTFVPRTDQPVDRLHDYYQPIAQLTKCEWTLDCVDCHTRVEAMGDGDIHSSKNEIQYVQCATCHGTPTELPLTKTITDPNDLALRLAQLNPVVDLQLGDEILVTEKGEALWNTRILSDGTYELVGKATRELFTFKAVLGSSCTQSGSDQSSAYCHQCHSVQR